MLFWQIILYTLADGMFFALLAMGFGLTLRSVKFFNLSYGGAFLVGGYMMFWFYRVLNVSFLVALFLSAMLAGFYLVFVYKFVFSVLSKRKAKNLVKLIASFGVLTATSAILGMIFGNQSTLIPRHLSDIGIVHIFGATLNATEFIMVVATFILIFIFAYMRYQTRFGRASRAIEDDSEIAELVGIPKEKTLFKIFFLSGVLAGLAGMVEGLNAGLIPSSGLLYMLPTIVACVIGGMESFWGGILGACILAVAQQLTIVFFGSEWISAVPFVILIIMLFARPQGILQR